MGHGRASRGGRGWGRLDCGRLWCQARCRASHARTHRDLPVAITPSPPTHLHEAAKGAAALVALDHHGVLGHQAALLQHL